MGGFVGTRVGTLVGAKVGTRTSNCLLSSGKAGGITCSSTFFSMTIDGDKFKNVARDIFWVCIS